MGLNPNDPRAPYMQIAAEIKREILEGKHQPGGQLPPVRTLARTYGVGPGTIQSALRVLRTEELITSWQGKGVIVRDPASRKVSVDPEVAAITGALENLSARLEDLALRVEELEGDRRDADGDVQHAPQGAPADPQGG